MANYYVQCQNCGRYSNVSPCYDCLLEMLGNLNQENMQLKQRIHDLENALSRFVFFLKWIEAVADIDGVGPLKDDDIVVSLNACGGGDMLTVGDFRRAEKVCREGDTCGGKAQLVVPRGQA